MADVLAWLLQFWKAIDDFLTLILLPWLLTSIASSANALAETASRGALQAIIIVFALAVISYIIAKILSRGGRR